MQISPNRSGNYDEGRGSHRVPENINHEYRQRADLIENSIKEYREIKQEIFTPEQLLQILDMKVKCVLHYYMSIASSKLIQG